MPRNSSGVYSLPESAFVPSTTIQSAPVNNDLSDIASALTQSLATTGVSSMTGPIKAANGSLAAPSITFSNDLGTGFYRITTNHIGFAINGVLSIDFDSDLSVNFAGDVSIAGDLEAATIELENTDNVDPLKLDWYEEGTFTPTMTFGGSSTGVTYSLQEGKFTRIGNIVHVNIRLTLTSNGSGTGDAVVEGLPYAALTTGILDIFPFSNLVGLDEFTTNIVAITQPSDTGLKIHAYDIASDTSFTLDDGNMNTTNFVITGFYIAET